MNKQWLIKINSEDNLYYDSDSKDYRLRLFCPRCHKPSGCCQCYRTYEDYERGCIVEPPVRCYSNLCCLLLNSDSDTENISKVAEDIGIGIKPFVKYTEKEAKQIIEYLIDEGIWEFSEESVGEQC